MSGADEALGRLFIIGCLGVIGIKWLWQKFAESSPEAVDAAKKRAEEKAIDLINRWLK